MLWLRLRWGLAATALYLLALAIGVQLVPNAGEPVVLAVLLLIASVTHMLQVFTLGPADLGALRSGYPVNMFALPMPTRALVGWPMLYGAVVHVCLWLLVVRFVLMPAGFSPPVWWSATVIAAFTVWTQAIGWSPFPIPFARVPAMALAMVPVVLLSLWAGVYLESRIVSALVVAGTAVWIACAYIFAIHGLSRARCGYEPTWSIPSAIRIAQVPWHLTRTRASRPFRSAATAQIWHECRRNAIYLPAMMAFLGLPLLVLNCVAVLNPESNRTMLFGSVAVSPAAMSLLVWIAIPLLLSTAQGPGLGKFDLWGTDAIPAFFAVRPMTTMQFIVLKLLAAAASACACWAFIGLFVAIWALIEGSPLNPHASLVRSALANLTPHRAAIAFMVLVGLILATWRTIVVGIWSSLFGRKWLSITVGIAMFGQLTAAVLAAGWVYRRPELQTHAAEVVPWMLGGLLVLKLGGAAGALATLQKLRAIELRTTALILSCWLIATLGILAAVSCALPLNWQLAAAIALFVPLVRILVAPIALTFNRHR
jgi:hypothetical protein